MSQLPAERNIHHRGERIPLKGGWKERTYYVIEICYGKGNQIHNAILYSSFLEEGKLTRRAEIFNGTYEGINNIASAYYLKAIREISMEDK